mgnify:FL=1
MSGLYGRFRMTDYREGTMLRNLYDEYFPSLMKGLNKPRSKDYSPTNPLLINVEKSQLKSRIPIMIFGQETNNWEGAPSKKIDELLKLYHDYYKLLQDEPNGTIFHRYHYYIKEKLQKKSDSKYAFVWNNICKVGIQGKGWHGDYIEKIEQSTFNIIEKEISIIKPKYFIFFTGPGYQDVSQSRLPELKIPEESVKNFKYMKHISFKNIDGLMTYHPNYINRNGKEIYLKYIVDDIINKTT